jgi:hypothetical protein
MVSYALLSIYNLAKLNVYLYLIMPCDMNKTEKLNRLFSEWEKSRPDHIGHFVKDGIVDDRLFKTAPFRILFIAKEPHNPKMEPGDFRDDFKNELNYFLAYRIAQWSYGLLNNFPPFDSISNDMTLQREAIQQIAYMNIKKIGGGLTENKGIMIEHAIANYDNIHKEISIIDPDLIVLGVSGDPLRKTIFPNVQWEKSGHGIDIGLFYNIKVIDFYHPSSRSAPAATYSLLKQVYKEVNRMSKDNAE